MAGEGAEAGGVDTSAPSPGKLTWAMTAHDGQWTNQDVCLLFPWKRGRMTSSVCLLFCFVMSCIHRIKVVVTECVFLKGKLFDYF